MKGNIQMLVVLVVLVVGVVGYEDFRKHHHLIRRQANHCNLHKYFGDPATNPESMYTRNPKEVVLYQCKEKNECKGLGDILKGVVSTGLMGVLTNHRLAIQVAKPPLANYYTFPSFFVTPWWDEETKHTHQIRKWYAFNHIKTGRYLEKVHNGTLFNHKYSYVVRTNANYLYDILNTERFRPILVKNFENPIPEHIFGCVARYIFRPTLNLLALASSVLRTIPENVPVIGVHIRTGDGDYGRAPVEEIESFFECYKAHLGDKYYDYYTYFASDRSAVFDIANQHLDTSRLVTYPDNNTLGHSDFKCKDPNVCNVARERTIIEHFVLSHVDSLIVGWSGFSKTAAWMGGLYDPVMTKEFCACVRGKTVDDFMEMKNGKMVPIWRKSKCSPLITENEEENN